LGSNEIKVIGGYKLTKPMSSANSGFAKWSFAVKDGVEYFIKEFLCPVYPQENSPITQEMLKKKIEECESFYWNKKEIYSAINSASNGNIVLVKDFFRFGTHYYLVTDKVEISKIIIEDIASLPMEKKLLILKVLTHSVNNISSKGIVHGDLKPDNILIKHTSAYFYTVKLIDFDSGFFESKQPENIDGIQGDTVYLAPESYLKIIGEDVMLSAKIDVFSLGIIFHQYLCGKMPVFSKEYDYLYEAVLDDEEITLDSSIPNYLRDIIKMMLIKQPSQRVSLAEVFSYLSKQEAPSLSVKTEAVRTPEIKPIELAKDSVKNKGFKPSGDFD